MNANETLRNYNCSDEFFKYTGNLIITEGCKALADTYHCYWFLDIIASYQHKLKGEDFQVWKLTKYEDESCLVECTDGNDRKLVSQVVDYTDFKPTTATVWVEYGTALLPSEH